MTENSALLPLLYAPNFSLLEKLSDNVVKTLMQLYCFACNLHQCHDVAQCIILHTWNWFNPTAKVALNDIQMVVNPFHPLYIDLITEFAYSDLVRGL